MVARRRWLAVLSILVLGLAGCGGSGNQTKKASAGGLTAVTFVAPAIGQVGDFVLAAQKGIFKKHGIDLKVTYVEAAAVVPTLLSAKADFGWLNAPATLAARANNVPVKAVTVTSVAGDKPAAFPIQVVVPKGSKIKSPQDLPGKKVAVDTLFQLPDLGMRAALLHSGVDPSRIHEVEIPFPDQLKALQSGRVDAILSTEPFVTIAKKSAGIVPVLSAASGQPADTPQSVVLASEKFIGANNDLVQRFRAAADEANAYANAHQDEMRATIPTFTKVDSGLASAIALTPISTAQPPEAAWNFWADLLVKVGAVKTKPSVADALDTD